MIRIVAMRGHAPPTFPALDELSALLPDPDVLVWVDLTGSADEPAQRVISEIFKFHPLAVEECFAERERPKLENYDGYLYCITHGLARGSSVEEHEVVELDAFLGPRYLVTYHAKDSRSVEAAWDLVRQAGEPLRRGPAALLQSILDRQVDGIEPLLDDFELRLSDLEERMLARPAEQDLAGLVALRRNLIHLRRWLGLQRDVVLRLARNEPQLVPPSEALHFRDTHDHLARFTELLETYRELTNTIQEATLSVINNRLGENMKFLTLFTAVLMPLSLLAGIYGMNFTDMPGQHSPHGFFLLMLAMLATAGGVLYFFWRKGWLGQGPRKKDEPPRASAPIEPPKE
ncbi:MAG TPA: magnesium/cobalt transporter CorA [Polyangia bacterium]